MRTLLTPTRLLALALTLALLAVVPLRDGAAGDAPASLTVGLALFGAALGLALADRLRTTRRK